ncbi:MAG: ADP-ribose [Prolixibacteraceae bacterium]|nr:MAG: ADP-ribose [Prolixibacteraceae bacterium]
MNIPGNFVIRVYAIIVNENQEVLISDEFQLGIKMTKFPGGGLEFGEGTIDGLKRELREECNSQELINIKHFYTTDFFQKAHFYNNKQLISIYYQAELAKPVRFPISNNPFNFTVNKNGNQSFRWVKIKNLNADEITFPIDKFVAGKLKLHFL